MIVCPKVFIVIVTYNPKPWLEKCFSSLRESNTALKTIVIDNCSTDGSQEIIKGDYPEIEFIESTENLGFGKANNIGIRKALDSGADYVFLLNQDAWIEKDTIEILIKIAEANPQYGIVSPMHLNGNGSILDYNFSYYLSSGFSKGLISDIYLEKTEDKIYSLKFVNAAAWLLTRKCVEKIGGFSPSFFHYSEDDNYCQRVLYHGLKIGVVPSARIYHDRDSTQKGKYFTDFDLNFKRVMISELSNPYRLNIIKFLYRRVKIQEWKKLPAKTKIFFSLEWRNLRKNRKLTKTKGKHFL